MALDILTSGTQYEAGIRLKIFGVNDTTLLADEDINNPVFTNRAERLVKLRLPSWSGLTGDNADWLRDAVISQTCALLMPSVRNLINIMEKVPGVTVQTAVDPDELETQFWGEVDYCLSHVSGYVEETTPLVSDVMPRGTAMFDSIEDSG